MSKATNQAVFVFNTDLGNVITKIEDVSAYDVEDLIGDKAFSQAQIVNFERVAENIDVNALRGSRAIKSDYLPSED
jgi:hypothetical protein